MFACETIRNGNVMQGSKEVIEDVNGVVQNLIETAETDYAITVAMWLGGLDTQRRSTIDVPNGLDGDMDRWTYIPWLV